jgi:hypothetical protein
MYYIHASLETRDWNPKVNGLIELQKISGFVQSPESGIKLQDRLVPIFTLTFMSRVYFYPISMLFWDIWQHRHYTSGCPDEIQQGDDSCDIFCHK